MLTKMALAALVGTLGVGALATPASAEERGGRGGFVEHGDSDRGRIEPGIRYAHGYGENRYGDNRYGENRYGGNRYGEHRGVDRDRRSGGWERARYDYAPVGGRGYCR